MHERVKYTPRGPCAIDPRALGAELEPRADRAPTQAGDLAVVDVHGPLVHHFAYGFDSYDALLGRVRAATQLPASTLVLCVDSPGGDVYGLFETARAIRAICDAANKRLVTYVSGAATSAALAIACAADEIYASATACVGSVGVIDLMVSVVRQDAAMGIDTATITSGERKADGNPHVPLSEAAIAAHQAHVNDLAGVFFAWVAERRKLAVDDVAGMQAAVFVGAKAVEAGLVDEIADFHSLQEILKSGTITAIARNVPQGMAMTTPKASKYTDAMAALAALAEDGDEDAKKAMKKMLVAAKPEGDEAPASEKKPDAKAAEGDEKKPEAAIVVPAGSPDVAALAAAVKAINAREQAREDAAERTRLLAERPDLANDPDMKASLAAASLETLRTICKIVPKAKLAPPPVVKPTVGATAGQGSGQDEHDAAALKERMGLGPSPVAKVHKFGEADVIVFGATDLQAAKIAAERGF